MPVPDHQSETQQEARLRRAQAARRARGILAGTAGKRVLSEELIADRRAEARADSADPAA
ncbi:MAG: hypothetical protein ABSG43_05155 [Solirubrobacteraceae bacterium]